jgi:predicted phage terminase large subunit-like protein
VATAGPRGFSKSTIVSFAALAHAIVYDTEAFIVLMSAGQSLSRSLSRDLRNAFKSPTEAFEATYGPFEVTGGIDQWEVSVRGGPSIGVVAKSFGTEVRGIKHPERGIRPTMVVIDDGEKKDRVRNPEQRKKWWGDLNKDVLKLGPPAGGMMIHVVGTVLHAESMLAKLLKDPGWRSAKFQAIKSWSKHPELWEQCHAAWSDLTLGTSRRTAALAFYLARKKRMDEGVELLAPAGKSLFELYEMIWSHGLGPFLSEMQNDPRDPSAAIFMTERFKRFRRVTPDHIEVYTPSTRRLKIWDLRRWLHWDPALGNQDGDFAAIPVLGRDAYGYTYVLGGWMGRAPVSVQAQAAWQLAEQWRVTRGSVESNGFQQLLADSWPKMRREREDRGEYARLALAPVNSHENKETRIAAIEPAVSNGWLQFADSLPMDGMMQFDTFPGGDHDDWPDAIERAWRELGGDPTGMAGGDR